MNKNITRHLMLSTATFAAAGAAAAAPAKGATATTAPTTARKKPGPRVDPKLADVRNDIPLPAGASTNRGSKSLYKFDTLEVMGSFGVLDRDAKKMSSIVSNQNRKKAKDAAGNEIMVDDVNNPVKDGAGNVIGYNKINKPMPQFIVRDVDKNDPDKAKCRVWRVS